MSKKILFLINVLAILILAACAPSTQTESTAPTQDPQSTTEELATDTTKEQEFTLEELKTYNGRDGNRAYVAVDGIVYDLTDSSLWKDGRHNGFEAGADLTTAIKEESPHGVSKLTGMPVVGKLVE